MDYGPLDIRGYLLPDRQEVIELMTENIQSLTSIQFWEVEDGPVVIELNGESQIWIKDRWCGMDSWEAVFEGMPLSFHQFREKWPSLNLPDNLSSGLSLSGG